MKKYIFIVFVFIALNASAQRDKVELYIQNFNEIAIKEMIRTGVPASITLAQGILESQSGESELVKKSNNHFGIKCKPEWTGARTFHNDDEKGECFRVYTTAQESYKDHSDFLRTRSHYDFLFKLDPTNYEAWAYGLKKAGYATEKNYPLALIKLIKAYNLDQYTNTALITPSTTIPEPSNTKPTVITTTTEVEEKSEKVAEEEVEEVIETTNSSKIKKDLTKKTSNYPSTIFMINQTKVIFASEGLSLLALANQQNISLSKLIEFNELNNIEILNEDQLIYLEKKQKKGTNDFHIVKTGESLHAIAQIEGVRLESILLYNNLQKDYKPIEGNKIYLKPTNNIQATANKN